MFKGLEVEIYDQLAYLNWFKKNMESPLPKYQVNKKLLLLLNSMKYFLKMIL